MLGAESRSMRQWSVLVASVVFTSCGARSMMDPRGLRDSGTGETDGSAGEAGLDAGADAPTDVTYDHVNDINGCNPSTCGGCCDGEGNCRAGLEMTACGRAGYACVNCAALNSECEAATRQCGPSTECGPATCPDGCCDGNDCVSGTSDSACGRGGQDCNACPPNATCDAGSKQCVGIGQCGPLNCPGCCDLHGKCSWGGDDFACGGKGQACEDCASHGGICDPGMSMCAFPENCGPGNCAGCCDASSDECRVGLDSWACGSGGQTCETCTLPNMKCVETSTGSGVCITDTPPPPDCGPSSCSGCCTLNNQCRPGKSNVRCGSDGETCENCSQQNLTCVNGDCVP